MAYHVVSGKAKEIDDTREYEDEGSSDSDDSSHKKQANGHAKYELSLYKAFQVPYLLFPTWLCSMSGNN